MVDSRSAKAFNTQRNETEVGIIYNAVDIFGTVISKSSFS